MRFLNSMQTKYGKWLVRMRADFDINKFYKYLKELFIAEKTYKRGIFLK